MAPNKVYSLDTSDLEPGITSIQVKPSSNLNSK
jgi:hypothetical protein